MADESAPLAFAGSDSNFWAMPIGFYYLDSTSEYLGSLSLAPGVQADAAPLPLHNAHKHECARNPHQRRWHPRADFHQRQVNLIRGICCGIICLPQN